MFTHGDVLRSTSIHGGLKWLGIPSGGKLALLLALLGLITYEWFMPATTIAQQTSGGVRLYGAAAQPAYSEYGTAAFDPTRYTTYYGTTASPFQYVGYGYGMYRPWLYRPAYYPYGGYGYPFGYGYGLGYGGYGFGGLGYGGLGYGGLGYGGLGYGGLGYGGLGYGGLGIGGLGFGGYGYRPWYAGYGYPFSSYYGAGFGSYGLGWGYPYNFGMFGPWGGLGGPLGWGGFGGCYYW